MGTRSLTHVRETENAHDLLCLYRQFDGYPTGIGQDIKDALGNFTIVNGIGAVKCQQCGKDRFDHRDTTDHALVLPRIANGLGCAAAQLVKALKDDIGNLYVYAPDSYDCGQEYEYVIWLSGERAGDLMLKVVLAQVGTPSESYYRPAKTIYSGKLDAFDPVEVGKAA